MYTGIGVCIVRPEISMTKYCSFSSGRSATVTVNAESEL